MDRFPCDRENSGLDVTSCAESFWCVWVFILSTTAEQCLYEYFWTKSFIDHLSNRFLRYYISPLISVNYVVEAFLDNLLDFVDVEQRIDWLVEEVKHLCLEVLEICVPFLEPV